MIETTFVCLCIFTFYYHFFIKRVRTGLLSLRSASPVKSFASVSVVIAARNEEKSIGSCLDSLINQSYPADKYEIIVVNDGSTDATASIVGSFTEKYPKVHLFSSADDSGKNAGSKPMAISKAISQASGEIILTTDADCLVPHKWIQIMAAHFEDDVVFVAGPVVEKSSDLFLSQLEGLEFLGLITAAAGLIGSGWPIICNGANLAYRRSVFIEINGFGNNPGSNDDESLMNRIFQKKIGKVVFAPEADAVVITHSSNTFLSFLSQRIRWANKRGHYEDRSILISLVSLYFFFLSMLITAFLIPLSHWLLLPFAIAFTIKVVDDYLALDLAAKLFRRNVPIFYFIIAELLHVPYIVIAAAIGQISSIKWKGRTIKQ
jgi:cellulose synthase/poly-beta-1,6-N-acetylglucosamine synthase-like glycosyltransferase